MSTCISRHGEFSDHKWGADFTCARCWVFDEDAALAALSAARAEVAAARAETQRVKDAVEELRALSQAATAGPWRADANAVRAGRQALALTYNIDTEPGMPFNARPDAAFIAAAANLVRAVLDGEQ